jgi:hypothetical protein
MSDRDERLGTVLRELEVPDHRPGFERELRRRLEEQRRPRRLRSLAIPAAGLAAAVTVAVVVLLLVGLPKSGTGPSTALAARVKAKVAERFSSGETLSGRIVYRTSGLRGPSVSRALFAMDFLGNLRVQDLQTHAVAVYEATLGVERSLSTSASSPGTTLFAAERRGVAPGGPDGGPSDAFFQRQLTSFARSLLAEPDPRVRATSYNGREAWLADIAVSPNRLSPDYDRLAITIDAATGVPVHVVATLAGKVRSELLVEELAVDTRLPGGVFALQFPPGKEVLHEDDGFRRVDLADAAARLGYEPLVPQATPAGYRFDTAAVAQLSRAASAAVANPPSRKVFSLSYRRGFEQLVVTTRLRRSGSGRWHDPLGVQGVPLRAERMTLHGGALNGASAQVVVDPRAVPHLWALTDKLVVTVSGDLSRDELLDVAGSLRPVGAATSAGCSASELRMSVGLQGATGSLAGAARFTNAGRRTCTLEGRPRVELVRADGRALGVRVLAAGPAYPPVELRPGTAAYVHLSWSNWCGGAVGRPRLRVRLPHGGGALAAPLEPASPRCDDAHRASTLGVGWFRPPA